MPTKILHCGGKTLDLTTPKVMGILNITPDSFSDGGHYFTREKAVARAWAMVHDGAAIIDVGGESTRPGARRVPLLEELNRVIPVIEDLSKTLPVPISIDTYKPEVMRRAVSSGASFINDIYALRYEGALKAAAELNVPICLMHMQGEPQTMQENPVYHTVVDEVMIFLQERVEACQKAGIPLAHLLIDPGFGFGKLLNHNLCLLSALNQFTKIGVSVLVGLSRKRMLGEILKLPTGERIFGSIAMSVIAAMKGAAMIRTHDVKATCDALKVVSALTSS